MKRKLRSFSFLMELIIVICFFALASTICVSLLAKAHTQETTAVSLQQDLIEAESLLGQLQATPQQQMRVLSAFQKIDEKTYQKEHLTIRYENPNQTQGTLTIYSEDKAVLAELPFVLEG